MATSELSPASRRDERLVAEIHVVADLEDDTLRPEYAGRLREVAYGALPLIEARAREAVTDHVGPEFEVAIELREGSIELVAVIMLIGPVVMTYGAVRTGLDYLRKDVAEFMRRLFGIPAEVANSLRSVLHNTRASDESLCS